MRDVLHGFALAAVIVVAALCTLVQLSDVNRAFDRLGNDEQTLIQQVSSGTGPGSGAPAHHRPVQQHRDQRSAG